MTSFDTQMIVTADVVLLTLYKDQIHVLLHKRDREPFAGKWALPGGFIRPGEDRDAEHAARRILREKAGMPDLYMEQLCTISGADRDPRGFSLSVAYLILVSYASLPELAEGVSLRPLSDFERFRDLDDLAFDHKAIIAKGFQRLRGKGGYSVLPAMLLPEAFTLPELQGAYEVVTGAKIDESSFRRKILALKAFEETGEMSHATKRPSKLWRVQRGIDYTFERSIA